MFMKAKEITNVTLTRMLLMEKLKALSAISAAKPLSRNKQVSNDGSHYSNHQIDDNIFKSCEQFF